MLEKATRAVARAACIAVAAVGLAGSAGPAGAATIAEWDLASATGQSADLLLTAAGVTATPIVASAGVTEWGSTAQDGFIAAGNWAPGAAPDPSKYYEWTITPDQGGTITYESVTLALFRGIQAPNHGAQLWDLRASTDGFGASDVFLQTFDITVSSVDEQIVFAGADISALGAVSGTVTFRLYGYDYTSPVDYSGLGNDSGWLIYGTGTNPVVAGTVAMPEPRSAALLAFGLVVLGLLRRRD